MTDHAKSQSSTNGASEFSGRVALVTGAASGIGAAVAAMLADRGAEVVVSDRDEAAATLIAQRITARGALAYAVKLDVTQAADVQNALLAIGERHGGLDLAVNSAGIVGANAPTGETSLDTWRQVLDVNLTGLFHCLRFELPEMLKRGRGAIVNVSSIMGVCAMKGTSAYTASKHGVVGLTKACALDYATRGIRVNAVAPGYVATPLIGDDETILARVAGMHPLGRIAEVNEIAEVIAFLLSDRASFITGSVHLCDGGFSAR